MAISVKGIQYSYQIDFFNQVPTRLKSQIHDLPVLSVQEATPVDINVGQDTVVPNNDDRQSFAGVRAASTGQTEPATNASPAAPTSLESTVQAAPLPSAPMNNAINTGYNSTPANLLAGQNPVQVAFDSELNLNRQRPVPTENLSAPPSFQPQLNTRTSPAVEAEDFPVADRSPVEAVKAMPRALYLQAQRAYKPDTGSYLQQTGYESPLQAGAVSMPEATQPATRPLATEPLLNQTDNMRNTTVEGATVPATAQTADATTVTAPENTGTAENNMNEDDRQTMVQAGDMAQNFLNRQAQRLYEAFANTTILGTSNRIDLYY